MRTDFRTRYQYNRQRANFDYNFDSVLATAGNFCTSVLLWSPYSTNPPPIAQQYAPGEVQRMYLEQINVGELFEEAPAAPDAMRRFGRKTSS